MSLNLSFLKQLLVVGAFTLVILIPTVAKERASTKFIFTHFNDDNGMGIHGKAYILALGLLTSQYSLLGYDTSAHMVCILFFAFFFLLQRDIYPGNFHRCGYQMNLVTCKSR